MRIPIYILTGFLGSGKTTLLNRCLGDARFADSAVLINEFGEIALDHLLVESVDEEVLVLDSGCVCCDVRDDFTTALLDLAVRREKGGEVRFERVVLETTGIADPNAVHQVIMSDPEVRCRYYHAGTITVVDGEYGLQSLSEYPEAVAQVVVANALLVSKVDLVSPGQIDAIEVELQSLNSTAIRGQNCDLADVIDKLSGEPAVTLPGPARFPEGPEPRGHSSRFTTFSLQHPKPVAWDDLNAWLEALLFARGGDIFRIKGWASVEGRLLPVVINSVHHALYQPVSLDAWPNGARSTALTFICQDFTQTAARRSFMEVCCDEPAREPEIEIPAAGSIAEAIHTVDARGIRHRLLAAWPQRQSPARKRPWQSWALHNPWALASTLVDSWTILDIAHAPELLDAVARFIGPDIILFDSRLQTVGADAWRSDLCRFAVDPMAGAVARLPLGNFPRLRFEGRTAADAVVVSPDQFLVHDPRIEYRYAGLPAGREFQEIVFRYFPATSRYIRDRADPVHRALMEAEPLVDHAHLPLWLVRGDDRADNDFVTGFDAKAAYWGAA